MKPMKIGFNSRVLNTTHLRGWSRYAYNLLVELAKTENEVLLISDQTMNSQWIPNSKNLRPLIYQDSPYIKWEQSSLLKICKKENIDILHAPANYGLPFFGNFKKILTLHDSIEKSFYGDKKKWTQKLHFDHIKTRGLHKVSQWAADQIITVSEHAKNDIHTHYNIPLDKITVIYEAADPIFHEKNKLSFQELKKIFPEIHENYFFYIGGLEERKNINLLLETFALRKNSDEQLIVAGGTSEDIKKYKAMAHSLKLDSKIIFIGPVEDSLLPSLYSYAYCFLYPSFYEGFGLQIVESLQMDTPVLCANTSSLTEILGDNECGFSPHSKEELSNLIDKIKQSDFYTKKKQFTEERKKNFSWKKTSAQTLQVYNKVLSS